MNKSAENPNQGSDDGLAAEQSADSIQIPPPRSSDRRPRREANPDDPRDEEVRYERAVTGSIVAALGASNK